MGVISLSVIGSIFSITSINIQPGARNSWMFRLPDNPEESWSPCAISEDGKYVVVGSGNNYLYFFEKSHPTPLWRYRMIDDIRDVDISSNGQYIVASDGDGTLFLFRKTSSTPIWNYTSGSPTHKVKISSDGNYIILGIESFQTIVLFQRNSSTPLWNATSSGFNVVDISHDGEYIVSVRNGVVLIYDKSNSSPIWQYDTGEPIIGSLSISPNGEFFAVGGQDSKIHVFNKTGPSPIKIYSIGATVRSVSLSEDGSYIAVGSEDGFYLFEISNSTEKWKYFTDDDGNHVAISSDGNYMIGGSVSYDLGNDYLFLFNTENSNPQWVKPVEYNLRMVDINSDGKFIAATTGSRFYMFDRDNPFIDEANPLNLNLSYIGLGVFIGLGLCCAVIFFIQIRKERIRIKKETRDKEILEVVNTLDDVYKEWEDKERDEEGKI